MANDSIEIPMQENLPKNNGLGKRTPLTLRAGEQFGFWTFIGPVERHRKPSGSIRYLAAMRCACGTEKTVDCYHAISGRSVSCGCHRDERSRQRFTTHGQSRTKLFRVWKAMRERCRYPKHIHFSRYGGRGITVCDEWQNFFVFFAWAIANGWRQGLQIDRINGDGNYSPENCRLVTPQQQARNTSRNRILDAFGESKCVAEWSEDSRCAVSHHCLRGRVLRGWPGERAITEPLIVNQRRSTVA